MKCLIYGKQSEGFNRVLLFKIKEIVKVRVKNV